MTPMGKKRPGIGILPLLMIVFLCISWLTALNRQDEMTYDQMVQLFEQQKVESFQFTDSSTLVMQLHDGSTARCRIHDYTLFYNDLNDLVKEQKAAGILRETAEEDRGGDGADDLAGEGGDQHGPVG